jgi:hypothetical protein
MHIPTNLLIYITIFPKSPRGAETPVGLFGPAGRAAASERFQHNLTVHGVKIVAF